MRAAALTQRRTVSKIGERVAKSGRTGTVISTHGDASDCEYDEDRPNQYGDCVVKWDSGEELYEWAGELKPAE